MVSWFETLSAAYVFPCQRFCPLFLTPPSPPFLLLPIGVCAQGRVVSPFTLLSFSQVNTHKGFPVFRLSPSGKSLTLLFLSLACPSFFELRSQPPPIECGFPPFFAVITRWSYVCSTRSHLSSLIIQSPLHLFSFLPSKECVASFPLLSSTICLLCPFFVMQRVLPPI